MLRPLPPSKKPNKPTFLERCRMFLLRIKRWWTGGILNTRLQEGAPVRSEAELAVERIVLTTQVAADCVAATVIMGGPAISIKTDGAKASQTVNECFIGRSYEHAADKAIEWLTKREGRYIVQQNSTVLSRRTQKVFNAQRRALQRQRRSKH